MRQKRKFEYVPRSVAEKARKRDHKKCIACRRHVFWGSNWGKPVASFHAIVPRSKGGTHELGNVATLCVDCHNAVEGLPLHTRDMIREWGLKQSETRSLPKHGSLEAFRAASEQLPPDIHASGDWHKWVYGGWRRPTCEEWELIRAIRGKYQIV